MPIKRPPMYHDMNRELLNESPFLFLIFAPPMWVRERGREIVVRLSVISNWYQSCYKSTPIFFFFQRLRKEQVCFQTIIFYGVIMANNYNIIWLDSLLDRKFDCNYWEIWYPLTWRLTIFGVLLNREFKKESMQPSKKRSMVLWKIYQGVDYSVFEKIANAKTAKETWSI